MDCFVKSHVEKEAIYEIYRSCRLCGGGAGYKMPIIQNVVNITTGDVELKDKIRECVQIEISQDDKMPPLICELCVDKIQDFYDFLEMCRRTNKRTRLRLGLPPQALVRDVPEAGDCILGITEPVYIKKETNTKKKGKAIEKGKDVKVKKEPEKGVKVKKQEKTKILNRELQQLLKSSKSEEIKAELLRRGNRNLDKKQEKVQKAKAASELEPKSILKKKDNTSSSVTLKRTRDKEVKRKSDVQTKKVKIVETPSPRMTRTSSVMINDDDGDGDEAIDQGKAPCRICRRKYHIGAPMTNHIMRTHKILDKTTHKCSKCKKIFTTSRELDRHKCGSESKRTNSCSADKVEVTVECKYCSKSFGSASSVYGHQATCKKRNRAVAIPPAVRKRLKPLQVRTTRCDPLLVRRENGHFDVSDVVCPYGLDKNCVYPYQSALRSSVLSVDKMVDIRDDITSSFELEDYVHWDSDNGTDSDPDIYVEKRRKVDSLTSLTLKTIFSDKFLGKVPKKKRKIKMENAFDSMLNASEVDNDFRLDIDSIIQNLGEDDKSERDSVSIKILNVFSQKEMDYDSDRTSFNDEFDTVQSKDTNQTTNFSKLIKSNLSTDINDETSTNSIDSSIGETSILQNVKEMLDRNELKTLLDTDVKESNLEDNKNDNVSDSDLNGVTNERNDKKLENEPSNTGLSVENEKSGNLNEPKNEFEKMNSDNSNHRNHDFEDAVLRLNSDEKCAEINYSSKNNHTQIDEQEQKENDISNGDTAKASIDKDDVKESDSNSDKDALKEKEENAISMSKGVSEETKNDPSKNNTENGIGSNGIIEIAKSTEALSVESAKSCSKNTNLDENSEKSEHSISEKSNIEANNVKIDNVGNKECSEVMNSVGNIDNTSEYVENVSANDDIEKSNRDLLNNTKNNSDNSNRNETTTPEINEIHELEYTNSDVHSDRNVNVTITTDDTSVNAKQKDYIDIGKNAENTQEINRDAIKQSDSDKNGGIDSDNFNMDDLEDVSDTDIDDSELMSDINEQLNERNDKNDKITLDDLLAKGQTDLDSISDGEFALDE